MLQEVFRSKTKAFNILCFSGIKEVFYIKCNFFMYIACILTDVLFTASDFSKNFSKRNMTVKYVSTFLYFNAMLYDIFFSDL